SFRRRHESNPTGGPLSRRRRLLASGSESTSKRGKKSARRFARPRFRTEHALPWRLDEHLAGGRVRATNQRADRKITRPLRQRKLFALDALWRRRQCCRPRGSFQLLALDRE